MKILLIDDDDALIALLTRSLSSQHHIVDAVKDGEMGWTYAATFNYDLVILDIMLPKLDGINLCKRLRGEGYTMPILLLTAQDRINAKVQGLDAGADDYVVKPFDIAELIARVQALLRRGSINPLPLLSWGNLMLNPSTCHVTYNGEPLTLTTKEYDLLELFLRDSSRIFSSDEIIDRLWSSDSYPTEATVRSHLRRLRQKLQTAGAPHDFISTIHGRGYYIKSPDPDVNLADEHPISPEICDQEDLLHPAENPLAGNLKSSLRLQQEQQYQAFLQETWVTTQPQCLQHCTELSATINRLSAGTDSAAAQQQAHQQVHKLVGTLGVFALRSAMEIARTMENLLNCPTPLSTNETAILQKLLGELEQEIETSKPSHFSSPDPTASATTNLPLFVLIDLEPTFTLSWQTMATEQGYSTVTLPTIKAGYSYLSTMPNAPVDLSTATVILVNLKTRPNPGNEITSHPLFGFMQHVQQRFPHWLVLVLSEQDNLNLRLSVVRHGGKFLSTAGLNTKNIFTAAKSLFQRQSTAAEVKVMVVDDDLDWLRALPPLLKPWGLKVTTLDDPRQFWTILQLIQPDAVILDVKMPEINGLELCQVLRSDPHWHNLPILFLSAAHNQLTQQEAFRVGADDYLCKPVMGGELAQRIRHRLDRLQTG